MQGSLDRPPIVIYSSRSKAMLLLLTSFALVAAAVFTVHSPNANHLIGYLGVGFFGLGIPIFGWSVMRPDRLVLSPEGITRHTLFGSRHLKWQDVHAFRPYTPRSQMTVQMLGFDFVDSSDRSRTLTKIARWLSGVDGGFGTHWEMQLPDLADLLNRARAHWLGGGE
jgi:Bacterial PH domain